MSCLSLIKGDMMAKKQYTKQEIHNAMKRLFDVDFSHRECLHGVDSLIYNTKDSNLKMTVDLFTGSFSGYELNNKNFVPPHGKIQSIKGI